MKFHFAIIGHGEADQGSSICRMAQDMIVEYNKPHTTTPSFNFYHVLVRGDDIQD